MLVCMSNHSTPNPMSNVTCRSYFPEAPMIHLCGDTGVRPTRAQVIAQNKADKLAAAEAHARSDRMTAAGVAAALAHAEADPAVGALTNLDAFVRPAVNDVLAGYEPDGGHLAHLRPILFAAVVAAVKEASNA